MKIHLCEHSQSCDQLSTRNFHQFYLTNEAQVMRLIQENPNITRKDIQNILDVSERTVRITIQNLVCHGDLRTYKQGRFMKMELKRKLHIEVDQRHKYRRL